MGTCYVFRTSLAVAALLSIATATAQNPEAWKAETAAARVAVINAEYTAARDKLASALKLAEDASDPRGIVAVLRQTAALERLQTRLPEAAELLTRAFTTAVSAFGDTAPEIPPVLSELAIVRRAMEDRKAAVLALLSAIRIRQLKPDVARHELAADLTSLATLRVEMEEPAEAKKALLEALAVWESTVPADAPQLLPVLDALGAVYRDASEYPEAEAIYRHSLLIRETIFGPTDAELISTVDSLSYVLFGQKKYEEAEPMYKRLLAIWERSAGPDHPMVALTLEKMAEFYTAQKRYADAEPLMARSLEMRTTMLIGTLNRAGRVQISQSNLVAAEELYRRAIRISDEAKMPDEVADPLLRTLARILREHKQNKEADALDGRVKAALARKAEKEGLRPSPVKPVPPGAKPAAPAKSGRATPPVAWR
jgi:tetratricopeptide (TPR) repeat protein